MDFSECHCHCHCHCHLLAGLLVGAALLGGARDLLDCYVWRALVCVRKSTRACTGDCVPKCIHTCLCACSAAAFHENINAFLLGGCLRPGVLVSAQLLPCPLGCVCGSENTSPIRQSIGFSLPCCLHLKVPTALPSRRHRDRTNRPREGSGGSGGPSAPPLRGAGPSLLECRSDAKSASCSNAKAASNDAQKLHGARGAVATPATDGALPRRTRGRCRSLVNGHRTTSLHMHVGPHQKLAIHVDRQLAFSVEASREPIVLENLNVPLAMCT